MSAILSDYNHRQYNPVYHNQAYHVTRIISQLWFRKCYVAASTWNYHYLVTRNNGRKLQREQHNGPKI